MPTVTSTRQHWVSGSYAGDLQTLLKIAENYSLYLFGINQSTPGASAGGLYVGRDSKGLAVIGYGYDLLANGQQALQGVAGEVAHWSWRRPQRSRGPRDRYS